MCEVCRGRMRDQYYRLRQAQEKALYTWMAEIKEAMSCADCDRPFKGDSRNACWDHRPGEVKIDNISTLIRKHASREVILVETQKCDLVCPRCHGLRGAARGQLTGRPRRESS